MVSALEKHLVNVLCRYVRRSITVFLYIDSFYVFPVYIPLSSHRSGAEPLVKTARPVNAHGARTLLREYAYLAIMTLTNSCGGWKAEHRRVSVGAFGGGRGDKGVRASFGGTARTS